MIISIKDAAKLFSVSIMSCCAVFVCTLFLNFRIDLVAMKDQILTPMRVAYDALLNTSVVVCAVTGGCLLITAVIMMIFYIKHYIDTHKKELGILKALGYPRKKIAASFSLFGISVLLGTFVGFGGALGFMPIFYESQNEDGLICEVLFHAHFELLFCLVILPSLMFGLLAVVYAYFKLKASTLSLIKDDKGSFQKVKKVKTRENLSFLDDLKRTTVKSRKSLIFFIIFASFCYGAMTQMSYSMKDLSSEIMGAMMLMIGLLLAFVTLLLAVTTLVNGNIKTIAMMKVFGYSTSECRKAILNGYRPLSYIGFGLGTIYQYGLLRIMVDVVFADYPNMVAYEFNVPAFFFSLITFILIYELFMCFFSSRIHHISIKEIMLEG